MSSEGEVFRFLQLQDKKHLSKLRRDLPVMFRAEKMRKEEEIEKKEESKKLKEEFQAKVDRMNAVLEREKKEEQNEKEKAEDKTKKDEKRTDTPDKTTGSSNDQSIQRVPLDLKDVEQVLRIILSVEPDIHRIWDLWKCVYRRIREQIYDRILSEIGLVQKEDAVLLLEKARNSILDARREFFCDEQLDIDDRLTLNDQLKIMRKVVARMGGGRNSFILSMDHLVKETHTFLIKKDPNWNPNKTFKRRLLVIEEGERRAS